MTPAGLRKEERVDRAKTGEASYDRDAHLYRMVLHWIPVSLKNRTRTMLNRKAMKILHFRDKRVQEDIDAIREVWRQVEPKAPICTTRMLLGVTVARPFSQNETLTGSWNRRRGDPVSAHELICDALEGIFYEDDSQVTKLVVEERRDCVVPSVLIEAQPR